MVLAALQDPDEYRPLSGTILNIPIQAIAIHTLLVRRLRIHAKTARLVIGLIWLFIALVVRIGFGTHQGYYV
jgi:hypothetical protein